MKRILMMLMALMVSLTCIPFVSYAESYGNWSEWSLEQPFEFEGRQIESRSTVVGYNLVLYLTRSASTAIREYRSYSINGNYSAYGLSPTYSERKYTTYISKEAADRADKAVEGSFVNYTSKTNGYNKGSGTALVGWGVENCLVWFIDSEVRQTEYRYRDLVHNDDPNPTPEPTPKPTPKYFNVKFLDWNGDILKEESVQEGKSATAPSVPERSGYRFEKWSVPFDSIYSDLIVTAQYILLDKGPALHDLTYSFSNSSQDFRYPSRYRIPYERFTLLFGDTMLARRFYNWSGDWGGSCFGMVATASMFYGGDEDIQAFNSGARQIYNLGVFDKNASLDLTVRDFIEVMQISQNDSSIARRGENNMNQIVREVERYSQTGEYPVVIAIWGRIGSSIAGHAVLGYRVDHLSDSESRLYVYDPNYPNEERYLSLRKNSGGKYVSWYYSLNNQYDWGSNYSGNNIYFNLYQDYNEVWNRRGNMGKVLLTININQADIKDKNGKLVASLDDGILYTDNDDVQQIENLGVTVDGDYKDRAHAIWLPKDLYQIENREGGSDLEVSLTDVERSISVATTASKVTLAVEDQTKTKFVKIEDNHCDYNISLLSTAEDEENEIDFRGITGDSELVLMQKSNHLQYSNLGTQIKVYRDGADITKEVLKNSGDGSQDNSNNSNEKGNNSFGDSKENSLLANLDKVDFNTSYFRDVKKTDWFFKDLQKAKFLGLMDGKKPGKFFPKDFITYAEVIKLAACINQLYYNGEVTLTSGKNKWYDTYVDYAKRNGIISKSDNIQMNKKVDRKTAISIFARALPVENEFAVINDVPFNAIRDVKKGDPYYKDIYAFYRTGILSGVNKKGDFTPNSNIRRSEIVTILMRLIDQRSRIKFELK